MIVKALILQALCIGSTGIKETNSASPFLSLCIGIFRIVAYMYCFSFKFNKMESV